MLEFGGNFKDVVHTISYYALDVHFKLLSSLFSTQKIFIQFQRKLLARHILRYGFMEVDNRMKSIFITCLYSNLTRFMQDFRPPKKGSLGGTSIGAQKLSKSVPALELKNREAVGLLILLLHPPTTIDVLASSVLEDRRVGEVVVYKLAKAHNKQAAPLVGIVQVSENGDHPDFFLLRVKYHLVSRVETKRAEGNELPELLT